jgi:hypothetical protein
VSPSQRLLELYSEYKGCPDEDPRKLLLLESFEREVAKSSQNGDFNDQLAPENIQAFVHYLWEKTQKK